MTQSKDPSVIAPAAAISEEQPTSPLLALIGLFAGPLVALAMVVAGPPAGLDPKGWWVVCLLALMAIWWITESVPIAATALLPLIVLPALGITKAVDAASPYADPIIFLFIGGFMLAVAVERWGLHARLALGIAGALGGRPVALIGGFLLATGFLSMWISNTAAALMLTPIAIGVARTAVTDPASQRQLTAGLVLAVAYAASIGGIGTPIGSPTNLVAMSYLERQGLDLSFSAWMTLAVPLMLAMLAVTFVLLWAVFGRTLRGAGDGLAQIRAAQAGLGPITAPEVRVLVVFVLVAYGWIFRDFLIGLTGLRGLTDMAIALAGALALFLLPAGGTTARGTRLLDWPSAAKLPWGIALLFGAGLSMAAAMEANGVTAWLAAALGWLNTLHPLAIVAMIVALTVFLSELASNTATLTALLPVVGAVAAASGVDPLLLVFPAAMGASLAFMLPIGTPPNAIAYASGAFSVLAMARIGFLLNLAAIGLITGLSMVLAPLVLGTG